MSLPYLLFSSGVLTSYLPCLSYPGCLVQHGGRRETLNWGFQGMLQIFGEQIIRKTVSFNSIHQRLQEISHTQKNVSQKITWGSPETLDLKCLDLMPSQAPLLVLAHGNLNLTFQHGRLDTFSMCEIWKDQGKNKERTTGQRGRVEKSQGTETCYDIIHI